MTPHSHPSKKRMVEGKIIINIRDGISELEALSMVTTVIEGGRVSMGANNKKHYCWLTRWKDGRICYVTPKYKTNSDIFTIYRESR